MVSGKYLGTRHDIFEELFSKFSGIHTDAKFKAGHAPAALHSCQPDVHSLIEQIPIYGVLGEQRQMEPGMQALHKEHK